MSKMVGFIFEVLTLLLTPILTILHMVYVRAPYMEVCRKCHKWHIWHPAFDMHIYVNIGVKRRVRTSGMQQPSYISFKTVFRAKTWNILFPDFIVYAKGGPRMHSVLGARPPKYLIPEYFFILWSQKMNNSRFSLWFSRTSTKECV